MTDPAPLTDEELAAIQGRDHALSPYAADVFLRLQPDLAPFVSAVHDRHCLIAALRAERAEVERLREQNERLVEMVAGTRASGAG